MDVSVRKSAKGSYTRSFDGKGVTLGRESLKDLQLRFTQALLISADHDGILTLMKAAEDNERVLNTFYANASET